MSPRRNHRRDDGAPPLSEASARRGVQSFQSGTDGEWQVRAIPGDSAEKTYRCPGCDQEIRRGTAHLVAWPADGRGDESDRRHWHSGCWRARATRRPRIVRGR